jgi:hypothetical protein
MSRAAFKPTTLGLWYILLRYKAPALALTDALATRLREVLSAQYDVSAQGASLTIRALDAPRSGTGVPALMLAAPGAPDEKLYRVLQTAAEMAKPYVAPDAAPQAQVDSDTLTVWWGGPSQAEAVMSLRPIPRAEIGL